MNLKLVPAVLALTCTSTAGSRFNETFAKLLMGIDAATLCPDPNVKAWNCSRCDTGIFPPHGVEAMILVTLGRRASEPDLMAIVGAIESEQTILLAIRGSKTVEDYIYDALFYQDLYTFSGNFSNDGWMAHVHAGFSDAYLALGPDVVGDGKVTVALRKVFAQPKYKDYKLVLTGHSLGASVANLFAGSLLVNNNTFAMGIPRPTALYTFGQPRTGEPLFAQLFAKAAAAQKMDHFRVVNKHDIVPHIPPMFPFANTTVYHHVANEVWLTPPNGVPKICDGSGEDPSCSASVPPTQWTINDHVSYFGLDANPCSV